MGISKNIAGAILATALGASLIGGGTFALFTSTTTNEGNTFTAGKVSLQNMTTGTLASQEINFNNLVPGDSKTLTMTVKNDGNLEEWVRIDPAASDASRGGKLFEGTTPLTLTYSSDVVKLAPNETHDFTVVYNFPKEADDSYQNQSGSFKVVVQAVQARNNTLEDANHNELGPISWQ